MHTKTCKQCGSKFVYCRACVFRPIRYKDLGYCSNDCYEASKNKIEEVVPIEDVEVVVTEEDTSTPTESAIEYPYFFTEVEEQSVATIEEPKPKKKRTKIVEEVQKENEENENQQNNGATI